MAVMLKMDHVPIADVNYQTSISIPYANRQREFATWVEAKEKRVTDVADWMPREGSAFEQIQIEIGQSYAPFIAATLTAPTANNSDTITVVSTNLLRVGDVLQFQEYYSGSTTEFDDSRTERATILDIPSTTTAKLDRHENAVSSGSWFVHPTTSVIKVVGRAQNYNTPFPDAIVFRGDSIFQHPQRWDSGEITYDLAAVRTPDFESPSGHFMTDVMYWKRELPRFRNDAFINGIRRTGDYLPVSGPKIPYRMGGMVWFAGLLGTNVVPVNGQLNIFDFSDVYEDLAINHLDGVGDTIWMHPRMLSIWAEMLLPYKNMFGPGDTSIDIRTTKVKSQFGQTDSIQNDPAWPVSKILLTSKSDWRWQNFLDMDWTYVERGPKELGAFQKSWTMGGDFSIVCENLSHQRLLTGVDTRKDLYPARTNFL